MSFKCKNPDGPVTSRQTFALKCCTGKDFREDISSRKINRQEFSDLLSQCNVVKKSQSQAAAMAEAERLLANFPSI